LTEGGREGAEEHEAAVDSVVRTFIILQVGGLEFEPPNMLMFGVVSK
jgi:hypothetical protein